MNFYRLIQGDCLKVLPALREHADLAILDLPFFVRSLVTGEGNPRPKIGDFSVIRCFADKVCELVSPILKDNGKGYFFCDFRSYPLIWEPIFQRFLIPNVIVWNNGSCRRYSRFRFSHQFIIYFVKKYVHETPKGNESDIWDCPNVKYSERLHSTQKPEEIIRKMLLSSTKENDVVIDPFLGSGTTMKVCQDFHRNCIGIEIDPKNCEIIKNRCFGRKFLDREIKCKFEVRR